jgi:hypothetical protein
MLKVKQPETKENMKPETKLIKKRMPTSRRRRHYLTNQNQNNK